MATKTVMLLTLTLLAFTSSAVAAKRICEVVKTGDKEVVLKCEDAEGLIVGGQVILKTKKKRKAVEGC